MCWTTRGWATHLVQLVELAVTLLDYVPRALFACHLQAVERDPTHRTSDIRNHLARPGTVAGF
jgi:hypothetical protein